MTSRLLIVYTVVIALVASAAVRLLAADDSPSASTPDFGRTPWTVSQVSKGQMVRFGRPGEVDIFAPNGDGFTLLMRDIPRGEELIEFSYDLAFTEHEDADGGGFAMNSAGPRKKIPRAVIHVRDQNFDVRGQKPIPWTSEIGRTYRMSMRRAPDVAANTNTLYGIFVDGKRAGTFSNDISRVGFHISEARVSVRNARLVLRAR